MRRSRGTIIRVVDTRRGSRPWRNSNFHWRRLVLQLVGGPHCIPALDAATGQRIWHFQTIHHDLWDWDLPAQPNVVTVRRDGKDIPAVAPVPDYVFFSRALHAGAGHDCATCHGPVSRREVLSQEVSTSMIACMNCHAEHDASVECHSCHELGQ